MSLSHTPNPIYNSPWDRRPTYKHVTLETIRSITKFVSALNGIYRNNNPLVTMTMPNRELPNQFGCCLVYGYYHARQDSFLIINTGFAFYYKCHLLSWVLFTTGVNYWSVGSVRNKHQSVGFNHQKCHRTTWFSQAGNPVDHLFFKSKVSLN